MARAVGGYLALDLDGDRLIAVHARVSGGAVRLKSLLERTRPAGVDGSDATAVGAWVRSALSEGGLPRAPAVLAVPRSDVVLKQLSFPAAAAAQPDLAEMVRLQLGRQMTMDVGQTAIDFAPLVQGEASAEFTVLAGAMPGERLAWLRTVARSAGLKVRRIGLRASGVAALVSSESERRGGAVLGIALGAASAEFVIVRAGQLVFARGSETSGDDPDARAARVAVEARRTWMAYRGTRETGTPELVAVVGGGGEAELAAARCGAELDVAGRALEWPGFVEVPRAEGIDPGVCGRAAPLIGLLGELALGTPALDYAHPRRGPDPGARTRRLALAGTFGLLLLVGGGGLLLADDLRRLRGRVEERADEANRMQGEYLESLRDEARLRHVERWREAGTDWTAHLRFLADRLPDTRFGRLDEVGGSMTGEVVFAPVKSRQYEGGAWTSRRSAVLTLSGRVADRSVATGLRQRLLDEGLYEVESRGPDTPDRFALELRTTQGTPERTGGSAPGAGGTP